MAKTEQSPNHLIRSIARALRAIERLAEAESDLGVVQVSQDLRLPRSTAHRILATLVHEGYAAQNPRTDGYHLTLRFVELGGLVRRQVALCDHARPYMRRLVQSTGESVGLAAFDGRRVLVVDQIEDPDRMWLRPAIGGLRWLHSTAAGKAVLVTLPSDQRIALLGNCPLPRCTGRTVASRGALEEQLVAIRDNGYAVEDEEHEIGVRAIASAVRSKSATLGAIEIVGPAVRLSLDRISELARYVKLTAEELSLSLGYEREAAS